MSCAPRVAHDQEVVQKLQAACGAFAGGEPTRPCRLAQCIPLDRHSWVTQRSRDVCLLNVLERGIALQID